MALTSLGNIEHGVILDWKTYNSIVLKADRSYPLFVRVTCGNFDLAYSTFELRVTGSTKDLSDVTEYLSSAILAEPGTQLIKFFLFSEWEDKDGFVFSVRRVPTVFNQSNLAVCSVELLVDPKADYK